MVYKRHLSLTSSLLPLGLLVLTSRLNVGSVNAQTLGPEMGVGSWELGVGEEKTTLSIGSQSFVLSQVEQEKTDSVSVTPSDRDRKPVSVGGDRTLADQANTQAIGLEPTEHISIQGSGVSQTGSSQWSVLNRERETITPTHHSTLTTLSQIAQAPNPITPSQAPSQLPDRIEPPSQAPLETPTPAPLPPPEELLQSPPSAPPTPPPVPGKVPETITVERFEFEGNTAFSDEELAKVTAPFTNRPISFAELFQVRSAVTQLYINNGYLTSGALIPPQTLAGGVIKIQVVEGGLEAINVTGTRRLNPNYVRSRIAIATEKPLNRDRLLEALQLLQLNPLIQNLSAELAAGTQPGLSVLEVKITEAKTFGAQLGYDNNRSPSVGTDRRRVQLSEANLLGLGDGISVSYSNTDGSNGVDLSYTLPINPRNGTLRFSYGTTSSNVIEPPFNRLDINSDSRYYELTLRQPIVQTPTQEFALGLTATRQESTITFLPGVQVGFPSPGADNNGSTRISALRFFQEWTKRSSREVIAARSQFSFGIGTADSTLNKEPPDSRFISWRGQAQWVRLLAPDTLFLLRGDLQVADRALVPLEQFGLGGQQTIRGYRQDFLLTDNGALASAEVRFPIARIPQWNTLVQLAPFVDLGGAWNNSGRDDPDPGFLASIGLGLQVQLSDRLTLRLDYGIPLVSVSSNKRTWQENGFYFSIVGYPF
ncbi:MAG TPA: ShlB/FhaC/HecB family hemolysin secretion/activation protein [Coleofasciculaceae cyanobacterium]